MLGLEIVECEGELFSVSGFEECLGECGMCQCIVECVGALWNVSVCFTAGGVAGSWWNVSVYCGMCRYVLHRGCGGKLVEGVGILWNVSVCLSMLSKLV